MARTTYEFSVDRERDLYCDVTARTGDIEGDMSKPEVCRYFIRGRCTYGDRCRYHHPGVGKQSDYSKRRAMGGVVSFQIASDVIGPVRSDTSDIIYINM